MVVSSSPSRAAAARPWGMAKPKSFLLVGLPHTGVPLLTAALEQHRDALARARGARPGEVGGRGVPRRRRAAPRAQGVGAAPPRRRGRLGRDLPPGAQAPTDAPSSATSCSPAPRPTRSRCWSTGWPAPRSTWWCWPALPTAGLGLFPDELDLAGVLDPLAAGGLLARPGARRGHRPRRPRGRVARPRRAGRLRRRPAAAPRPGDGREPGRRRHAAADRRELRRARRPRRARGDRRGVGQGRRRPRATTSSATCTTSCRVRPADATDPARAAYDDRIDMLTDALAEAVAEVGRLRERLRELERGDRKRSVRLPGVFVGGA